MAKRIIYEIALTHTLLVGAFGHEEAIRSAEEYLTNKRIAALDPIAPEFSIPMLKVKRDDDADPEVYISDGKLVREKGNG